MFKKYPLISRATVFVALPLVVLLLFLSQTVIKASLPITHGKIEVNGLTAAVEIKRDTNGLVEIVAEKNRDIYFAMGFVHAQDRLWQLEIQRRASQGKLSEIFGKRTVEQDIWIRTLGIYRAAKRTILYLSQGWAHPARAQRITQLINDKTNSNQTIDVQYIQQMLSDVRDLSVINLLEQAKRLFPSAIRKEKPFSHLINWNGVADRSSQGATIYYSCIRHLKQKIFADELRLSWNLNSQNQYMKSLISYISADKIAWILSDDQAWCDNIETVEIEDCQMMLQDSYSDMKSELTKLVSKKWNLMMAV